MSLTIMIGTIFLFSGKYGIVSDGSWASNPRLILDGVEDLVDGEPQRSGILFRLEGSEGTWREDRERLTLEGKLPPVQILGIGGGFVLRL